MIRAVFDTNVLASGFLSQTSTPGRLLQAWLDGLFELLVSEFIFEELGQTFDDPYFRCRLDAEQIEQNQALLRREATVVNIVVEISGIATHPEDDLILAAAVSSQAQFLVTGDAQLLGLASFSTVNILSPRAFLDFLHL